MSRPSIVLTLCLASLAAMAAVASQAGPEQVAQKEPPKPPAFAGAIDSPRHWSALPEGLTEGLTVTKSWFIQFELPDGSRSIPARIFLVERREEPARITCLGHEIDAPGVYEPDYLVPKRYVRPMLPGVYRVNLGNLEAFVRTVK